jgi:hypothetical protein
LGKQTSPVAQAFLEFVRRHAREILDQAPPEAAPPAREPAPA